MTEPGDVEPAIATAAALPPRSAGPPVKGAKAARRAEKSVAKGARKAARAAGKAARKAEASAAKAARKAESAAAKAARKAQKTSATLAAKPAKAAAKAQKGEAKAAAKEQKRATKEPAAAPHGEAPPPGDAPGEDGAPAAGVGIGVFAVSAGAVLEEVAGLVRQAGEPAGARILERAPSVGAVDVEAAPAAALEPAPEAAADAEPEPEPEREPEPQRDAEPEPAAVPEPEPELQAEPEPAADESFAAAPPVEAVVDPALEGEHPPVAHHVQALTRDEHRSPVEEPAAQPAPVEIPEGATIHAAIDVGSTSVHLLVAAIDAHQVVPLLDESVFLGLGDRVATDGRISAVAREELVQALATYADRARAAGATDVTIAGTEPMRRAADAATVIRAVEARAGAAFHVVDHDEEGLLTLLGVTLGRPLASSVLVIDVGGGSTEFVAVDPDGHGRAMGLPLGANRLTRELVRFDPPSLSELEALKARVREVLVDAPDLRPGELIGVGGTASNLLKLLPATAVDRVLTRRRLTVALAMLTVERSAEAAQRHLLRPERARILPAGAIIVDAILERYGSDRMRVSDSGVREGLALAVATAGPAWRDRLPALARGWKEAVPVEAVV